MLVDEFSSSREKIEQMATDATGSANTAKAGANEREQHVRAKKHAVPVVSRSVA
jgi:hypothetical protein